MMKKVHNAYETFNKAHQLVPQPSEYNQHIVHNYAFAKGLKCTKKQDYQSECENEY